MALFLMLIASCFAAISNLCFRKSIDVGGSSRYYLINQMTVTLIIIILLNPVRTGNYHCTAPALACGLFGGVLLGLLMFSIAFALERGPPGITFAITNSATVMPAIFMALLFGSSFGHPFKSVHALATLCVVGGFFWAGLGVTSEFRKPFWVLFALGAFLSHTLFLTFLQWWALVVGPHLEASFLLPLHLTAASTSWFMPAIFFSATSMQWLLYFTKKRERPTRRDIYYGTFGGLANGGSSFLMIVATQYAQSWENPLLFPTFAVFLIILNNLWASRLYREKINWKANGLALGGLMIAALAAHT